MSPGPDRSLDPSAAADGTLSIAVVIPALNEAGTIARTVQDVLAEASCCVVVDGGSTDDTVAAAAKAGALTLRAPMGRASQMNAGFGAVGACEVVLFLHADTALPAGWSVVIESAVRKGARWGRFDVEFPSDRAMLGVVAAMMNLRSRLTGICTGDQAIFVRSELLRRLGGFASLPLMEDIELSTRLKQHGGAPVCLRQRVSVSARRWEKHGVWRTITQMWWIRFLYFAGVSPHRLHAMYYGATLQGTAIPDAPANKPGAVIIVLARAPVPGAVKTRLAATIGDPAALQVYRKLLERTLACVAAVSAQRWLYLDIDASAGEVWLEMQRLATQHGLRLGRQSGGDLGQRMQQAMADALADGARVVLVGADCPILAPGDIEDALAALEHNDAVFAPTEDGGYALVGLARPAPALFDAMPWSTDAVMAQTRTRILANRIVAQELRMLWDVDTHADLQRWVALGDD